MSTIAQLPAERRSTLRLRWSPDSPLPLPPTLLQLEQHPRQRLPHFSHYRVGMVVCQLDLPRPRWSIEAPWRAPERSVRMAGLMTQLLSRCESLGLSFDLLVFPAGTLNYYGIDGSIPLVLGVDEIGRVLGTLRRAHRAVSSVVFGVDVWGYAEESIEQGEERPAPHACWQYLVAADVGGDVSIYQKQVGCEDDAHILQPGDGSRRVVRLGGRQVRLGLDAEQFDGGLYTHPAQRERDGAELWVNPIHIHHAGGGATPGRWAVGRIATTLKDSTCPIFLPHYRRTRLDGPFWFAGHPDRARPHRWQPAEEVRFRCGNERVQLLTFDLE